MKATCSDCQKKYVEPKGAVKDGMKICFPCLEKAIRKQYELNQTKCPCGAPVHTGPTLPCFEGSQECLSCQNERLSRMCEIVWSSKW